MAAFIVLRSRLFTTKLSCLQKNNFGHTTAAILVCSTDKSLNIQQSIFLKKLLGLEDDDLFLNFDADEIPKLNVIEFLKFHDGIPPVFQFNLRQRFVSSIGNIEKAI